MKEIAIGCDHAGYSLKEEIVKELKDKGYVVNDFGCYSEESVDYPDFGHQVAQEVEKSSDKKGIVICGSGNGINMSVNKHENVRGALCWNEEIAALSKQHNNANIISIPSRFLEHDKILSIVDVFIKEEFEGGRHERRIKKIDEND